MIQTRGEAGGKLVVINFLLKITFNFDPQKPQGQILRSEDSVIRLSAFHCDAF